MGRKEITVLYYDIDGNQCSKTFIDKLIPTTVSGLKYCKEFDKVKLKIKKGDNVVLMFEPYNEYDPNAIACYWKGIHIGYIPKKDVPIIMKQIAMDKCSCEATVDKLLDVSVVVNVPFTALGDGRTLVGAKAPKPMTEDERKEYNDFYDDSKDDESNLIIRSPQIRIPFTKDNASALEKMRVLQRQGNKCEYIGYVDSDNKPLLYSEEIDVPVYIEDEELCNYILNNKEVFSFISNVVVNETEMYIELWFVITIVLQNNNYKTPLYTETRRSNNQNDNTTEKIEYLTTTIPNNLDNLLFVQSIIDYKETYYEDVIFYAFKSDDGDAILYSKELDIFRLIESIELKKRVLNGEMFAIVVEILDDNVSRPIKLKLSMMGAKQM